MIAMGDDERGYRRGRSETIQYAHAPESLNLRDEYSETELEVAPIHRRLRSLAIIGLKLGKLMHAAAGWMHLYCNYG